MRSVAEVSPASRTVRVMGVLNTTPDSFSDGGLFRQRDAAVRHALHMVAEGADIIDVGGESTRPGAEAVGVAEELERVIGVIEAIRRESPISISVDTSKPEVMVAAVAAGADMINDVRALQSPRALPTVAGLTVPVCLMHMQGEPQTMQRSPRYDDVVSEVLLFLRQRMDACVQAGIPLERIVIDPGFGFGKTLQHNLLLLRSLARFTEFGVPVLVGLSRKSMISQILAREGRPEVAGSPPDRLGGSVTLALYAARHGASIVRVHDVRQTVAALAVQRALAGEPEKKAGTGGRA